MKSVQSTIVRFLTQNNVWIHLVVISNICFLWVMTFNTEYRRLIYLDAVKWRLTVDFLFSLIVLFSPVLLFAGFRKQLSRHLSVPVYYLCWAAAFIVWPSLAVFSGLAAKLIPVSIMEEVVLIISIFILVVDVVTAPDHILKINPDLSKWQSRVSPEWVAVIFFGFWSFYGTRMLIEVNETEGGFLYIWSQNLVVLVIYYLFYRLNHYFLLDHIYRKKGLFYYGFGLLGAMLIFTLLLIYAYVQLPAFESFHYLKDSKDWIGPDAPSSFWSMFLGTITTLLWWTVPLSIVVHWLRQSNRIIDLQRTQSATELNLLKQQINPHFFFNTLNNVYSMSLTNDEKTSEGILQLSDLMRYVIYKGPEDEVSIVEEVKYIEDFLRLQKMRLHSAVDILFNVELEKKDFPISPLLLIILVENAFKHGIEPSQQKAFLHMDLVQVNNTLRFSCLNSYEEDSEQAEKGIGLLNLRRRLDLIYPSRHSLQIEKKTGVYKATLTIQGDIAGQ